LKRRNVWLFFGLPFLGVFVFFALSSVLTQADLKRRTEGLVRGQLAATAGLLRTMVSRSLDGGTAPGAVLDALAAEEALYFVALLDGEGRVLAWNSRFEGYLPLSLREAGDAAAGIIDSPAGKIFSDLSAFATADGRRYRLYLGYALTGWEDMLALSRRASFLLSALILLAGALFFRGLYTLQSRYVAKAREAEAERQEKERFREISAFTSGVAHEIKNPLNSLSLLFDLLDRRASSDMKGDLNLGKAQVRTIARIVDRFSNVVKAVRPAVEDVALDDILAAAVASLAGEVPQAARRVRVEASPGARLAGDRELLAQAFLNLFKNAVEASPDAPVTAAGRRTGGRIEVLVRDDGPGLPPEAAERLFEPFSTTKEKGMGIGLYLTKRIVEAHGGTIAVRSRPGEGTTFRIELPGA